jgi:uncharacterized protein YkwD
MPFHAASFDTPCDALPGASPVLNAPGLAARPLACRPRAHRFARHLLASAAWLVLAACGGGGGDDAVAAPPAGNGNAVPPSEAATCGLPGFGADALVRINGFRSAPRSCGAEGRFAAAPALVWNTRLQQSATAHSQDMAAKNYFSHTGQDGRDLAQRVGAAGYAWTAIGENIAAGPVTVAAAMAGWQASDGHCANLMNPAFTEVGLACVPGTARSTYATYWTMNLGKPR